MDFPQELSCYNELIESLAELDELNSKKFVKVRVLHCKNLVSMQGIENQVGLIELNLSSNAISRIEGIHDMSNLVTLNLSCNNIRVINCLGGLFSLQKLNLSFNKISSLFNLKQLYGPQYSNFTHFDIRGNNISQLLEIKNLAGCTFLIDLAFQGQTGANPVCKDPEYIYSVIKSAPSLKFLDHQPVSNYSKTIFQEIPKIHSEKQKPEENNENQEIIAIETKKQKENNENLIINKKLQQEFDELYDAYKELSYKYKHSEDY